jgi:flagellar biosynthesis protein FlhG
MARIISVAGGKTGVGSTTFCINLALGMALSGYKTCFLSAENVLPINAAAEMTLERVVREHRRVEDAMARNYYHMDILFAGVFFEKAKKLRFGELDHLLREFTQIEDYDFIVIDVPLADSKITMGLCTAASEVVMAINNDPSSIAGAYSMIKSLVSNEFRGRVAAVINQCQNAKISNLVFEKLRNSANRAFRLDLFPLGAIQKDSSFEAAAKLKRPLLIQYPDSPAAKEIRNIAALLAGQQPEVTQAMALNSFLENFFRHLDPESVSDQQTSSNNHAPVIEEPMWSGDALQVFNRIADNIAALAQEVGALRHLVEHQGLPMQKPQGKTFPNSLPVLELDFESYLSDNLKS